MQFEFFPPNKTYFYFFFVRAGLCFFIEQEFVFLRAGGPPLHLPTTTTKKVAASGRKIGS